jgi:cyclopropane-fatty-acyl-phospholipid synthase
MLERLLREYVREGSAAFSLPDGRRLVVGDDPDPPVAVRLADWSTLRRIAAKPALAVGEAFMDGGLIMERGSIYDLVDLVARHARFVQQRPDAGRPQLRGGDGR